MQASQALPLQTFSSMSAEVFSEQAFHKLTILQCVENVSTSLICGVFLDGTNESST